MVNSATAAQDDFTMIFAGMDESYPAVEAGPVTYAEEADGGSATAQLTMRYPLGEEGWAFTTTAPLRYSGDQWAAGLGALDHPP